jgi:hypothetical protein
MDNKKLSYDIYKEEGLYHSLLLCSCKDEIKRNKNYYNNERGLAYFIENQNCALTNNIMDFYNKNNRNSIDENNIYQGEYIRNKIINIAINDYYVKYGKPYSLLLPCDRLKFLTEYRKEHNITVK